MIGVGGVFGLIGFVSIIYLASRPALQLVVEQIRKSGKTVPAWLKKVFQFVTKTHRYVGFVAVGAIAVHIILQFVKYGYVPIAGLFAGLALAIQAVLGFGLTKQKDKERRKKLAQVHRVWGMFVFLAVLFHRVSYWVLYGKFFYF